MARFLVRRLLNYVVLVVLAASLAYLLAAATLRPRANFEERSPRPPASVVDAQLTAFNLNDRTPLARRYLTWASGLVRGDLGRTWDGDPVTPELWRRALVSVRLLVLGTVLGGVLGVLVGAFAAVRQYRTSDRLITVGSFAVLSTPVFVLAVLLQIGAERVNEITGVQIFEWVGEYTPGETGGMMGQTGGRLQHLVLPTLTIVLAQVAVFSRYQRHLMLDVIGADFVRTAMARGLTRRRALFTHGLRIALIPVTTYFAYTFGLVLLGAMFTEKIFGWHGMGEWLIDSINRGDVNAVAAVNLFAAVLVLLAGLASDTAHGLLDPRVRAGR
ncbi:ABC transporter permease [Thermomonospora umbrina]|uniref:Peptide/nickel transport system permease protein n=1 Tax=Thermomonospora umbrina TaxID=111806 RepID=A0A3D9SXN4_9ACTN|nr:ABC transporter permease [Thermomonospora umbrina]REE99270.1 peptide/nickel transport system permease protein [Thermomonospora umbrina]